MGFSLREFLNLNNNEKRKKAELAQKPLPANTARPQLVTTSAQKPLPMFSVGVAAPRQLKVGSQMIAPSSNAVSGVQAPQLKGGVKDFLGATSVGLLSSAEKAAAATARGVADLRFATPNFIPGVSSHVDPFLKKTSNVVARPFEATQQGLDQLAKANNLYDSQAGQKGKALGNKIGAGAIYVPQIPSAVRSGVEAVKTVPKVVKGIEQGAIRTTQLVQGRQPLNAVGAVGKNVRKVPSPAPTTRLATTPVRGVKQATPMVEQGSGITPVIATVTKPPIVSNSLTSKVSLQNLSPEAQKLVSGEHIQRNTKLLGEQGAAAADQVGTQKAIEIAHELMAVKPGTIDDQNVSFITRAIEKAGEAGKSREEAALHDSLSEHLTANGQTSQAAQLLYNLTPQGRYYKAVRDISKALPKGQTIKPELDTQLKSLTQQIKQTTDPATKNQLTAQFQKLVADNLPKGKLNGVLSVWKAGLLSGVKTQTGNALSNETFDALKNFSNPLSAAIDKALSLATKERTKTLTVRGRGSGTVEGYKKGFNTLKTGIDSRNINGNKYDVHGELNFKNPALQKVFGGPSNLVFRAMSAGDQPVYYRNLKQNLYDLGLADGKNKGLRGSELRKYATDKVANPTHQMADAAKLAADKSVLAQDSPFASALTKFAQSHSALQVVVPFVKVPTNFLTRTLDYTPVGAIKQATKSIKSAKAGEGIQQRALSEALGEATTGSAVLYLGAELANHNLLSGQYPSGDPKEAQRWKAEGITPNSVKIGNKWISLNYLGPVGLLLGAGKDYHDGASKGDNGTVTALAGFGKNLSGQSFLSGFSGFANALNDPGRYGSNLVSSEGGSIIPSWSNDLANLLDKDQRQTNNVGQTIQSRVPILRNQLPIKNDVYGNPLNQRTNPIDLTVDPLRPSNELAGQNPVLTEVARLHQIDPNNSDLQVTPTPVQKVITVDKNKVNLTDSQRQSLQKQIGQATQTNWARLIQMPEYQSLSDLDKANALNNLRQASTEDAQRQYVLSNNLGTYSKQASSAGIRAGTGDISSFAKEKGVISSGSNAEYYKSPDAEYKALQSKYDEAIKNNTYGSDAARITAEKKLKKAKIGSTFDKDIRDLYGLSKSDIYNYVSTNSDGANIAKQLEAYDQALYNAGLVKYRTFANGIAPASKSGSGKKTSTAFLSALKSRNAAASSNQNALLNLVKNAKVKSGSSKNLKVTKVALKKQTIKKQKATV